MPRRSSTVASLCLSALLALAAPALAADSATSDAAAESVLVDLINDRRAEAGVPPLTQRADLHGVARRWSFRMAERGGLSHNGSLGDQVCCWRAIGENVARAGGHGDSGSVARARVLLDLWRNSGSHDATMTDPNLDQVGVGVVVDDDGTVWGTVDFRLCDGTDCAGGAQGPSGDSTKAWGAPPEPEAAPAPKPEPESEPAPRRSTPGGGSSSQQARSEEPQDAPDRAEPEPEPDPEPTSPPPPTPAPELLRELARTARYDTVAPTSPSTSSPSVTPSPSPDVLRLLRAAGRGPTLIAPPPDPAALAVPRPGPTPTPVLAAAPLDAPARPALPGGAVIGLAGLALVLGAWRR